MDVTREFVEQKLMENRIRLNKLSETNKDYPIVLGKSKAYTEMQEFLEMCEDALSGYDN